MQPSRLILDGFGGTICSFWDKMKRQIANISMKQYQCKIFNLCINATCLYFFCSRKSQNAFKMIIMRRDFLLSKLLLFFGVCVDYSAFKISFICRDLLFWLSGSHQIANFYSSIFIIIFTLSLTLFAEISFSGRALWPSTLLLLLLLLLFFLSFKISIICSDFLFWPGPLALTK